MNQKIWAIITGILGFLLLISLIFLLLFGVRISKANKIKENEIALNLSNQEGQLKADFQSQLEETTTAYTADEVFGFFSFKYPKVWSTNVLQDEDSTDAFIFLANPSLIVNNKKNSEPLVALRVEVFNTDYNSKVKDATSQHDITSESPYKEKDAKVSGISGKNFSGKDKDSGKNISFVLVPLRDKTLYIGTDDNDKYAKNLETIIKSFKISK